MFSVYIPIYPFTTSWQRYVHMYAAKTFYSVWSILRAVDTLTAVGLSHKSYRENLQRFPEPLQIEKNAIPSLSLWSRFWPFWPHDTATIVFIIRPILHLLFTLLSTKSSFCLMFWGLDRLAEILKNRMLEFGKVTSHSNGSWRTFSFQDKL